MTALSARPIPDRTLLRLQRQSPATHSASGLRCCQTRTRLADDVFTVAGPAAWNCLHAETGVQTTHATPSSMSTLQLSCVKFYTSETRKHANKYGMHANASHESDGIFCYRSRIYWLYEISWLSTSLFMAPWPITQVLPTSIRVNPSGGLAHNTYPQMTHAAIGLTSNSSAIYTTATTDSLRGQDRSCKDSEKQFNLNRKSPPPPSPPHSTPDVTDRAKTMLSTWEQVHRWRSCKVADVTTLIYELWRRFEGSGDFNKKLRT